VWSTVPLRKRGLEHGVPYIKLTSGSLQNEYALVRIAIIVACTHGWYLHYAPPLRSACLSPLPAPLSCSEPPERGDDLAGAHGADAQQRVAQPVGALVRPEQEQADAPLVPLVPAQYAA
jgi:hypothetical protein